MLLGLYLAVGIIYASVTPMLEKFDEQGHYGYIIYLREHRTLPPIVPYAERATVPFKQTEDPFLRAELSFELYQPPLYYVVAALLTAWLPDDPDPDEFYALNPYVQFSVPGHRGDNRNYLLHPPDMTPLVFGGRLVSLLFGLGAVLGVYSFAAQALPRRPATALAAAAIAAFQPAFLFVGTAVSNDAAVACGSAWVAALLARRWRAGAGAHSPFPLGISLGLAILAKSSALALFPLVGLALLFIHRGFRAAFWKESAIVFALALLVGGWWYGRNFWLYGDPLTTFIHTETPGQLRVTWERLRYDLLAVEYTFWANPSRIFISLTRLDQALIWWGRLSLGACAVALLRNWRTARTHLAAYATLAAWPVTFAALLIVYWSPKTSSPAGRFLFPAFAPLALLTVLGWQSALPARAPRRLTLAILAAIVGVVIIGGSMIPLVSIYPLYHPARTWRAEQVERPAGITYVEAETGAPVVQLLGVNLPRRYAVPGEYFPLELCWRPLGRTDTPRAVFVHLLDVSRSPVLWGTRETYPGLGNRPTDRWSLGAPFCDTVLILADPQTPTPLGAAVEVGFVDPANQARLQAVDAGGAPLPLPIAARVPVLSPADWPTAERPALYVLDGAIGLVSLESVRPTTASLTLTTVWQARRAVPYDALLFVHLIGPDGELLAQADHAPLDGRFPTSLWLPGQVITDTVNLAASGGETSTLRLGMYLWPSLQRLPVVDAAGQPQRDDAIEMRPLSR